MLSYTHRYERSVYEYMMAFYKWYRRFNVFPYPWLEDALLFFMLTDEQKEYVLEQERIRKRKVQLTLRNLGLAYTMLEEAMNQPATSYAVEPRWR